MKRIGDDGFKLIDDGFDEVTDDFNAHKGHHQFAVGKKSG